MNSWPINVMRCYAMRFWASPQHAMDGLFIASDFRGERMLQRLTVYDPGFPRDDPGPGHNSTEFPTDVPAPQPHDVPAPEPIDVPPPDPGDDPPPTKPPERPKEDPKPKPIP